VTRRLLLSYLAIAVIVLVVLEVPLARFYQQRETDRLSVGVERDANALASLYEDALEGRAMLDPSIAVTYTQRTGARVVVVDGGGVSLVDTGDVTGRDFATRPEIRAALRGERTTGTRHSDTLATDLLYVAVPIASGGDVHGAVRLTLDTADVEAAVRRFWLGLLGVAAVVLTAMAAIGWAIARSVTRPLRQLHVAAARFATGDLAGMEPAPDAPPEIAELGATMNTMARRLDQLLAEHRAFVADASHQLRTPLTALRLRLENLQSDPAAPGSADDIAAAIDETGRLSALVGDLLQLARAERAATPAPVDLVELTRDRVDTWSAVAEAAGVGLEFAGPAGPVVVGAVPDGVEQILDNLIDNAITASPRGAQVTVGIVRGRSEHSLIVADEGPGLSDELKARALDRFWRLDSSQPGTGLGLPIADALARASGGRLALGDGTTGGLVVTVTLPATHARPPAEDAGPGAVIAACD
jgi:signal transduction histidine kinase